MKTPDSYGIFELLAPPEALSLRRMFRLLLSASAVGVSSAFRTKTFCKELIEESEIRKRYVPMQKGYIDVSPFLSYRDFVAFKEPNDRGEPIIAGDSVTIEVKLTRVSGGGVITEEAAKTLRLVARAEKGSTLTGKNPTRREFRPLSLEETLAQSLVGAYSWQRREVLCVVVPNPADKELCLVEADVSILDVKKT